jgi:glycosyltransferase involved in cell wall biosynthesis
MVTPKYPHPVVGGLEKQSHELAKALIAKGVKVSALSTRFDVSQAAIEVVDSVRVHRVPWIDRRISRFALMPLRLLVALLRLRSTIDVVHIHQHSPFGLMVILLTLFIRKPVITKLPNVGEYGVPGLRRSALGWFRFRILVTSRALVAMSTESLAELTAVNYPPQRILAVPNGITPDCDANATSRDPGRADVSRVVFVGRLSREKGINTLLRAWSRVASRASCAVQLELWGEGPDAAAVREEIERLAIADTVKMLGHIANVRHRLQDCHIFVLPSIHEGNSNAVLEAMAAGLPVVATPVGGTPMQVGPDGARLLIPVGDVDQLAERLLMLIENPNLRRVIGSAMRKRVLELFDISRVADRYICAYQALVSGEAFDLRDCGTLPDGEDGCAA